MLALEGDLTHQHIQCLMEPMAEIPAHELWLYKNPQALKDVREGLQQSKEGRVRKRGSFAKYAQDDI